MLPTSELRFRGTAAGRISDLNFIIRVGPLVGSFFGGLTQKPTFWANEVSSRDDAWWDAVVIVDAARTGLIFPIPVVISSVFWRTLQLLLGNAGPVAAKVGIILERLPREGIMIVSDTKKAAKAQNRVGNLA